MTRQRKFKLAALFAGAALFVLLIGRTDPSMIAVRVADVGWGFLLLIVISGIRHLLRTFAWYYSIDHEERRMKFRDLFGIRMAGEAVTDLTFLGPLLGEPLKGVALSRWVSVGHSASSLVIENLAYAFATAILIISGLALFVSEYALPLSLQMAGLIVLVALVLSGSTVALVVKKRYRVASRVFEWLRNSGHQWISAIEAHRHKVLLFEENFYGFYNRNKRGSALILVLEIMATWVGVAEAYAILILTAHRGSFLAAFIIEAVYRIVVMFFAFIPMRMGVDEGGAALVLKALGYGATEGVSLAIVRKIRTLFWVAVGLLLATRYSISMKNKKENAVPASK